MNLKILTGILAVLFLLSGCIQIQMVDEDNATEDVSQATSIEELFANETEEVEEEAETEVEEAEEETEETEAAEEEEEEAEAGNIITVNEGDLVKLSVEAADPDGNPLTYTFSEPLDEDGEWQTEEGDAGEYAVTVTVSDSEGLSASETLKVVVNAVNNAPLLEEIDDVVVFEGETVTLNPRASDEDDDELTTTYSGWMTSSTKATGYDDAGEYTVTVTVTDGTAEVSQEVAVTVKDKNRAPVISSITLG